MHKKTPKYAQKSTHYTRKGVPSYIKKIIAAGIAEKIAANRRKKGGHKRAKRETGI